MKLLAHDTDELRERFPEATVFIRAAFLREEAYHLLCMRQNKGINDWAENRLAELLRTPACKTHWFLKITENMRKTSNN